MNVWVQTTDSDTHGFDEATVTFDTTILQVVVKATTWVFPLCNVTVFSIDEATS